MLEDSWLTMLWWFQVYRKSDSVINIHVSIFQIIFPFMLLHNIKQSSLCCIVSLWWLSSVQSLSHIQLFATPWTTACQASLSITNSQSLLKLTSIKSMMPSNHLILCCSLLLLPSIFPASGSFPVICSSHQVAKVLEFQLQHQSFKWIFRSDFL